MHGFLDHLETSSSLTLSSSKSWKRRFFQLNGAFHTLEFFTDASLSERKGKIDLQHSQVACMEQLGTELLDQKQSARAKIAVESSRRFVFRITTQTPKPVHHYLCADVFEGNQPPSAVRAYMDQWLSALQSSIQSTNGPIVPVDLRELNAKIANYTDHMHVSSYVAHRLKDKDFDGFEMVVKAWILQRELVEEDDGDDQWQILEYSCAWKVLKTWHELRTFDATLRQFFREQLRDLTFPSHSSVADSLQRMLHPSQEHELQQKQAMQLDLDYWQQLLQLPAFSVFGSDGSTLLDQFLSISSHLNTSFRQLERETGQNLSLRKKKIVGWHDREQFELLYKMHMEIVQAQEAKMHLERLKSQKKAQKSQQHHRRSTKSTAPSPAPVPVSPPPATPIAPAPPVVEEPPLVESVQERIARIGQKLIKEAFMGPPTAAHATYLRPAHPTNA